MSTLDRVRLGTQAQVLTHVAPTVDALNAVLADPYLISQFRALTDLVRPAVNKHSKIQITI